MESCFNDPLIYVTDHPWQMALMIFGCALAIVLADVMGLNRPWPLSVILGGILAQLVLEAYPCPAVVFGDFIIVPTWAVMACMVYFVPRTVPQPSKAAKSVWDYFEEVDAEASANSAPKRGESTWVN